VDDASVINPTPEVADRGQDHDRSSEETRAEGKGSQGPGLCCSCRVYRSWIFPLSELPSVRVTVTT